MLRFLRIRNLAVIESVDVEFDTGFNVLTGETGAGKSILVEAVALLLGGRSSADLIRTGEPHASIEAIFEDPDGRELVVRREITSSGRSRSFIDGALATAGALKDLSSRLVELHGQHEHQVLLDADNHLQMLDAYAKHDALVAHVTSTWNSWRSVQVRVDRLQMDAREKAARLDLIAFQLGEIDRTAPQPGEDDVLEATKRTLANAERITRLCDEGYAALYDSDHAALSSLAGVWKRVGELAEIDDRFVPHLEGRDGIKSQLEDLAFFLRAYSAGIDASPARLVEVEDRLASLERLKRKYGPTLQDVLDTRATLARERNLLSDEEPREALDAQLLAARDAYATAARDLSTRRRAAAVVFARDVERLLAALAMDRTRLDVRFNVTEPPPDAWAASGLDRAEFFISPNPGEDLRPLVRTVSGGELSRIMLALKTLGVAASGRDQARTLIFDEVDAGIGGRVADVVGTRLQALGSSFQVLCITHLPQIAARGTTHFQIEKQVRGSRTVTTVVRLDETARVEEVARMIGGARIGPDVRASARELLANTPTPPRAGLPRRQAKGK